MRLKRLWIFVVIIFSICALQSQPPAPTPTIKGEQPEESADSRKQQAANDSRGTDQRPIVVKVLPSTKTPKETADDQAKDLDQSSANWWMVRLTGAIVLVGLIQTIVFGLQARRLKQTILKMEEISKEQTKDVQSSISQASRASSAMEGIAESMANNVGSLRESVNISREIADRQRLITELQSRAYLVVMFELMVPQSIAYGIKFEPRLKIINRGNTPAYNIRFSIHADVCDFPMPDDFPFTLSADPPGYSSVIGPGGMEKTIRAVVPEMYPMEEAQLLLGTQRRVISWGVVRYQDAFGMERSTHFGFTFYCQGNEQWISVDTARNNESN